MVDIACKKKWTNELYKYENLNQVHSYEAQDFNNHIATIIIVVKNCSLLVNSKCSKEKI
jgi:hypothetical protein